MGVNKVETSDGRTIMDISGTEATPGTVMNGVGFYDANGEWRTGELMPVLYSPQTLTEGEQRQARENIGVPEVEAITRLTSLPASGTTLTANAEYRVSATVGTYQFAFPTSGDVYVRFTTASTFAISFASGTTFLGVVPKFEGGKTYELMARDKCVAIGEVVSA